MKKLIKILIWIFTISLTLLILGLVGLQLFFPIEKAKNMAIEKGKEQFGRDISITDAEVSFWGGVGIKLQKVTVSNPAGYEGDFLTADFVDVKLRLLPLISGEYHVDRLIINEPNINLIKKSAEENNYTFKTLEQKAPQKILEKATPETKAAMAVVTFESLNINDGNLTFSNISDNLKLTATGLDLQTSLATIKPGYFKSSGELSINELLVENDLPLPQLKVDLKYISEFDYNQGSLKIDEASLKLNNITSSITGKITGLFDTTRFNLNLKAERNSINDLITLINSSAMETLNDFQFDGGFDLDADLLYDAAEVEPFNYFGTLSLTDIDVSYEKIEGALNFEKAVIDLKNDNVRVSVAKGSFDNKPFKAHVVFDDFKNPRMNGEISGNINLDYIEPFLPDNSTHDFTGMAQVDLKLSGPVKILDSLDISGKVVIPEGRYQSDLIPEPLEELHLDIYFDNDLTRVNKLSAKTESGSISFEGRVYNLLQFFTADSSNTDKYFPSVDGRLKGDLDLSFINQFLPPKGNPDLGGKFKLDLNLLGKLNDYYNLKPTGSVTIENGYYRDSLLPEPITNFNASFISSGDTLIVEKFEADFESSDVSFTGKIANPFPYLLPMNDIDRSTLEKPMFYFHLTSKKFDSDKLFPEAVPGSGDESSQVSLDSVSNIIMPDINGRGSFEIDSLIYSKIEFSSIKGEVKIHDRIIDCYQVTAIAYTGTVNGETTIDLSDFNNPLYKGEFRATQIEANDFITRFTSFGNSLFGKIDINGTYNASGWNKVDFLNSLTMTTSSTMKHGKLVTSENLIPKLSALTAKLGQSYSKEQMIKEFKSNVFVRDGKIVFEKLTSRLTDWGDLELSGDCSFDGNISYKGTINFTQSKTEKFLSQKDLLGGISSFLGGQSTKRIKIPIKLNGTVDRPNIDFDLSGLPGNLKDNLFDGLKDVLEDAVKKDSL